MDTADGKRTDGAGRVQLHKLRHSGNVLSFERRKQTNGVGRNLSFYKSHYGGKKKVTDESFN